MGEAAEVSYFDAYGSADVHALMLRDRPRVEAYKTAIENNVSGKVVVDVGAGSGILSLLAARSGASAVYAIEASERMCSIMRSVIELNGFSGAIHVINARAEDITLATWTSLGGPMAERVKRRKGGSGFTVDGDGADVILSEWMGFHLLHEGMLGAVLRVRDQWLRSDGHGALLPSKAKIWLGLADISDFWREKFDWSSSSATGENEVCNGDGTDEVGVVCGFDFAPLGLAVKEEVSKAPVIRWLAVENVAFARAQVAVELDLMSVKESELESVDADGVELLIEESRNQAHGFALWFDVEFPCGTILSTSPYRERTHWKQSVILLDEPARCVRGMVIVVGLRLFREPGERRMYSVTAEVQEVQLDPQTAADSNADGTES